MTPSQQISLIAFNLTVMIYGLYRVFTHVGGWRGGQAVMAALIAVVLGLIVGGVTYFFLSRKE